MAGNGPRKAREKKVDDGGTPSSADVCDLTIDIDLESVRAPALVGLHVGDILNVDLAREGAFPVVVCKRPDGTIIGALSAFRSLTQLIACIQRGVQYQVRATSVGRGSCHVVGGRISR